MTLTLRPLKPPLAPESFVTPGPPPPVGIDRPAASIDGDHPPPDDRGRFGNLTDNLTTRWTVESR